MQTATYADTFGQLATGTRTTAEHPGNAPDDHPIPTGHLDHVTESDRRTRLPALAARPCRVDGTTTAALLSSVLDHGTVPLTPRVALGVFQKVRHRVCADTPLTLLVGEAAETLGWFGRWVQFAACGSLYWHELTEPAAGLPTCPKWEWFLSRLRTAR